MGERTKTGKAKTGTDVGKIVKQVASAELPTRYGSFKVVSFYSREDGKGHIALLHGDVEDQGNVPVRIHSECLTGDVLGSLRCDCRDQLLAALHLIGRRERGILLYLRQEGRGIGLINKIRAYSLQDEGLDTVEANEALGFKPDERDYGVAVDMLSSLGVRSIKLVTNNPDKIEDLKEHGIQVEGRIPLIVKPTKHNKDYLRTKAEKMGHIIPEKLLEQMDRPIYGDDSSFTEENS